MADNETYDKLMAIAEKASMDTYWTGKGNSLADMNRAIVDAIWPEVVELLATIEELRTALSAAEIDWECEECGRVMGTSDSAPGFQVCDNCDFRRALP